MQKLSLSLLMFLIPAYSQAFGWASPKTNSMRQGLLQYASAFIKYKKIKKPQAHYHRGGKGPLSFDCSGFVTYILKTYLGPAKYNVGYLTAEGFSKYLEVRRARIDCRSAKIADLVFFSKCTRGRNCNHIGFVSNPDEQKFLSALSSNEDVKEVGFGPQASMGHREPVCYQNLWVDEK